MKKQFIPSVMQFSRAGVGKPLKINFWSGGYDWGGGYHWGYEYGRSDGDGTGSPTRIPVTLICAP